MDYIRRLTEQYWVTEVRTAEFVRIAAGKEIGHKIGDMVDEKTTQLLKDCGRFDIRHQQSRGQAASRSMGDLWLEAGFIYNPVNIVERQVIPHPERQTIPHPVSWLLFYSAAPPLASLPPCPGRRRGR